MRAAPPHPAHLSLASLRWLLNYLDGDEGVKRSKAEQQRRAIRVLTQYQQSVSYCKNEGHPLADHDH